MTEWEGSPCFDLDPRLIAKDMDDSLMEQAIKKLVHHKYVEVELACLQAVILKQQEQIEVLKAKQ